MAVEGVFTVPAAQRARALEELGIRRGARLTRASVMELAVNVDAAIAIYGTFDLVPGTAGGAGARMIVMEANLLDARRLRRRPAEGQTGPLEELSSMQNRLTWRLLKALSPGYARSEQEFLEDHPPIRLDALESYIRGLFASTLDQKLALFGNAARLEPVFSQPCFQLGRLHFDRKDYRAAAEWLARVLPSDSHHREAQFLLGLSRYHLTNFAAARELFAQVAEAAPLGPVLNNLGLAQFRAADPDAAATLLRAIESDEADPDYHFNLAYVYWRRGDYQAAVERLRAVLERTPEDETAALLLARCEQASGPRPGEPRLENLERLKTAYDDSAWRHLKAILGPEAPPQ